MRANANATILNKGTAIENPEIKKEVQFVFGQMNFFFCQWIYEWCGNSFS